uniref:RNase H type-1 domain-containing protein n=1 Tax=Megaselia scalaris TaxID=36166 RepID=T1H2Z5_MEGSC
MLKFQKFSNIPMLEKAGELELNDVKFQVNKEGFVIVFVNSDSHHSVFFDFRHILNVEQPNNDEFATIHAINAAAKFGVKKLCIGTKSKLILEDFRNWLYNKSRKRNQYGEQLEKYMNFIEFDKILERIEIEWIDSEGYLYPWKNKKLAEESFVSQMAQIL